MSNKGFTLTELIVTMAIFTIVMGISFPAITKLQTENKKKLYESYETALRNAAKLYVDKYDRDLWDVTVSGSKCIKIKYSELKCEDLIKEYNGKKGESVVEDDTIVYATKSGNSVSYTITLKIKDQTGNILYDDTEKKPQVCAANPIDGWCKNS